LLTDEAEQKWALFDYQLAFCAHFFSSLVLFLETDSVLFCRADAIRRIRRSLSSEESVGDAVKMLRAARWVN
jgi:hypothetical protein